MNFFKKIFGGDTATKSDEEHNKEDERRMEHEKMTKETHDKEHQGEENKKPKNLCEFC